MSQLISIAGKKNCNGTNGANTGKLGCTIEMSTPEHVIKMPKNFKIDPTVDFNLAYVVEQIQKGIFIPIIGATSFENVSSEDAYNTNSSGGKRLNVPGLPEYKFWFEEGHEFYKQLSLVAGYKDSAFAIIDDQGNLALAKDSKGNYKGFEAGHVTPEMRKSKVKGGENEMKALLIQFLSRKEWDINYDVFLNESLDFNPTDIPAVNGVDLKFDAIPQAGDTVIEFSAVLSSDKITSLEGAVTDNVVLKLDDVVTPSVLNEVTPGKYTLTVAALTVGQVVTIDLQDSVLNSSIVNIEDNLFRSEDYKVTVIA